MYAVKLEFFPHLNEKINYSCYGFACRMTNPAVLYITHLFFQSLQLLVISVGWLYMGSGPLYTVSMDVIVAWSFGWKTIGTKLGQTATPPFTYN